MMHTQISSLTSRLAIPITRIIANIAAIIKKGGELINSGILEVYHLYGKNETSHQTMGA